MAQSLQKVVLVTGMLSAVPNTAIAQADSLADLRAVPAAISTALRTHLFDPRILDTPNARSIERAVDSLARFATSRGEFIDAFNRLWRNGPASHIQLARTTMPASAMLAFVDTIRVGERAARLRWDGDIAILELQTMNGVDTRERLSHMFDSIVARGARGLIIDLRTNSGGTFAVVPLVGHVIAEPFETGAFVGQQWVQMHDRPPTDAEVQSRRPWSGWSLRRFWHDVENDGLLRIRLEPMAPRFAGPIVVLTSRATASAAEMAVDALLTSGRAEVIGERTAGQMLSQRMIDVAPDLQLYVPIADYYSARMGRIEGKGVTPTTTVKADVALDSALARLRQKP